MKRFPLSSRACNGVCFSRHLPRETMEQDFAADFAFRARGSRFSLLKSPRTAPGPDEFYGAFANDARAIFAKLLGLEVQYVGLDSTHGRVFEYNSMNYYRSHIEEFFYHNGVHPLPPLEGRCIMLFTAADQLRVSYHLRATSPADVPLRLRWFTRIEPSLDADVKAAGPQWNLTARQKVSTAYISHIELKADDPRIRFSTGNESIQSDWIDGVVPGNGELEFIFHISGAFNHEPLPAPVTGSSTSSELERAVADVEPLYANLPPLSGPFAAYEKLMLKAAGTLYSLRFRDRDPNGLPVHTIHAGKTGVVATWFGDTSYTLQGLGILGDRQTSRGAAKLLLDGIDETGRPPTVFKGGQYHYQNYQGPWLTWGIGHSLGLLPDDAFLAGAYPALVRNIQHWLRELMDPHWGLVRSHWGNVGDDGLRCYNGMPLDFKAGEDWTRKQWGQSEPDRFASPDINAHLYLELRTLAAMARRLGKADDATQWDRHATDLAQAINRHLLEPRSGVYQDRRLSDGAFNNMISMASFFPLYAGITPRDIAQRICRQYLLDEQRFYTTLPFPTLDRSHPCFRPGGILATHPDHPGSLIPQAYWIGRTWPFFSTFIVSALHRAGLEDEAQAAALKILDVMDRSEAINECYDSVTGHGNGHPEFMWTSVGVLILATQYYRQGPVGL